MVKAWLVALFLVMGTVQTGSALDVETVFQEPRIDGSRPTAHNLSPDEGWVAYVWNHEGYRNPLNLYVVRSSGGDPVQLTHFVRDSVEDSLRREWKRLRETVGAAANDSLEKLPDYFKKEGRSDVVGGIEWSPDSRRIVFTNRKDLYYVDVDSKEIMRLTHTHDSESSPKWSPDGRFVAFLRSRAIWLLEPGTTREIQLTKPSDKELSYSLLKWSPDGRRLAYRTSNNEGRDEIIVPNYLPTQVKDDGDRAGYSNGGVRIVDLNPILGDNDPQAIYSDDEFEVVDVDLGEGLHPIVAKLEWSPDGTRLLVDEVAEGLKTRKIHIAYADSGNAEVVYSETDSAWIRRNENFVVNDTQLEWSADGEWIYFTSEKSGFMHVARVPSTGGDEEFLTQGDWLVSWSKLLPDRNEMILLTGRESTTERHFELLDLDSRELTTLGTAPGMSIRPATGEKGGRVAFRYSRLGVPYDLWTIETKPNKAPVQVTETVPERYSAIEWSIPEIVSFPGRDGTPLRGFVYKPDDFDPNQYYPVVVFVHGAGIMQNIVDGWTIYSQDFKFLSVLASKGFVVFEVDYRGSLGYGRDFRAGVYSYLGGNDLQDELAGIDYLKTLPFVDTDRVGIYGGSYGGFMALMALFLAPDDFACGAALRFVADWANYHRVNPWYSEQRLGSPEDHAAWYYRSSPIHFAENLEDPLLLLHGVRDNNVHFQDAAQLTERLIRLGKDFELMMYPAERHTFKEPESWIDEYGRIEGFFIEHLEPDQN